MRMKSFPRWFHRANWAGGALGCLLIGLYPLLRWGYSSPALFWGLLWIVLGLGAANNARLGVDSIGRRGRFKSLRKR